MWVDHKRDTRLSDPYRLITSVFSLYRREAAYFSVLQTDFFRSESTAGRSRATSGGSPEIRSSLDRPSSGSTKRKLLAEAPEVCWARSAIWRDVPDTDTAPPAPVFRADLIAELKSAVPVSAAHYLQLRRSFGPRPGPHGPRTPGEGRSGCGCRRCGRPAPLGRPRTGGWSGRCFASGREARGSRLGRRASRRGGQR